MTYLSRAEWRKSSHSGGSGGNCVEVAENLPGVVAVRDSRSPGPVLVLGREEWALFIAAVRTGELDG
jgi:hypothetical protein